MKSKRNICCTGLNTKKSLPELPSIRKNTKIWHVIECYQSIEMLALNIGQNMIKREDEIRLKSEMLHAVEAKNLYESLKK